MAHELFYTSAPRGLRRGSNGYCTVAATRGLPSALGEQLERLSDYRLLFDASGSAATRNPDAFAHLRVTAQGKVYSVLSRICPAGVDHTNRGIFFAHHVALEPGEQPAAGPAWLLAQRGFLDQRWDGQVREIPAGRQPKMGDVAPAVCLAWKKATGDAGWAGVLAESFLNQPNRPTYLLYPLGLEPLPLLAEALALLPGEQRWRVTFSTLCLSVPQGVSCAWRCLPAETPEARKARATPGALILDLTSQLNQATGGPLVTAARTGKVPLPQPPVLTPALPLRAPIGFQALPPATPISWTEPVDRASARGMRFMPYFLGALVGVIVSGFPVAAGWLYTSSKLTEEKKAATDLSEGNRGLAAENEKLVADKLKLTEELGVQKKETEDQRASLRKKQRENIALVTSLRSRAALVTSLPDLQARSARIVASLTPADFSSALTQIFLLSQLGKSAVEMKDFATVGSALKKVREEKKSAEQREEALANILNVIGTELFGNTESGKILREKLNKVKKGGKYNEGEWTKALDEWTENETYRILVEYDKELKSCKDAIDILKKKSPFENAQVKNAKATLSTTPSSRKYDTLSTLLARKMKDYKRQFEELEKPNKTK